MKLFLLFLLFASFQADVPFKPSDEFQVNIDLNFKPRNASNGYSAFSQNGESLNKVSATPQPFLTVTVNQLKIQGDEVKVAAVDSQGKSLLKKKVSEDLSLLFEMGFVEDLKSKKAANEITLYFLSAEKKELRKIVFSVASDGVFEVNGKWHGQF